MDADKFVECPLLKKKIRLAYCCEVNEVLLDNMSLETLGEKFDMDEGKKICGSCKWQNESF